MIINNNIANINFSSRNKTIRFADDIARKVNKEFPRFSSTRIAGFKNIDHFQDLKNRARKKIHDLRQLMYQKSLHSNNFEELLDATVDPIREFKAGNCSEAARLTLFAARLNGITNCRIVGLKGPNNYSYDHVVVLVNDKKPYIIDSWVGFADYIPNAIKRYQKDFRRNFIFNSESNEKMFIDYRAHDCYFSDFVSREELKILNKKFPQMKINQKNK